MVSRIRFLNSVGFLVCAVLGISVLISIPAHSQVAATINGTVTDGTGASVPNAKLSIIDTATGITRDATADANGYYSVANLNPATYQITISAPGFSNQVRSGITLTVGAVQVLNIAMQVGAVTQTVEVMTEAPTVQLSSSAVTAEINEATVQQLPLNGRDWTSLATLQPGVTGLASIQLPATGNNRVNRGFGSQLTIAGSRPYQNNFRIDGITVNDYLNTGPGNAIGSAVGVDAIQEFSVISSNTPAEYGRTSGGVVNAVTRSGTNQLHGSAYEFLRNSALDARNFFDPPQKQPFRRSQFGASGGVPIRKDKTFLFVDYEGLRQSLSQSTSATVPSPNAHFGLLDFAPSTAFPTGCVANGVTTPGISKQCKVTVNPAIQALDDAIFPLPTPGIPLLGAGLTGTYNFSAQSVTTENFVTARFDHHFSDKDSIFVTYMHDASLTSSPDPLNTVLTAQRTAGQRIAIEETHIFSTNLVNSFREGYNRVANVGGGGLSAINNAVENAAFSDKAGYDAPTISAGSGTTGFNGGLITNVHNTSTWNSFQEYDDVNLTKGVHNIKFGGNIERDQDNLIVTTGSGGGFTWANLSDFLQNNIPTSYSSLDLQPNAHYRETVFGVYVQDDIRFRSNLTINLGLRYEMMREPTTADFNTTTQTPQFAHFINLTDPTEYLGYPYFHNPTLHNFDPRVGFAWDPFKDGKTSVRAGFGMFDVLPLQYQWRFNASGAAPWSLTHACNGAPLTALSFPTLAHSECNVTTALRGEGMEDRPKRNYMMQFNLSIQRQLTNSLTLTVAYVGSHGVHNMDVSKEENLVMPTLTSAGYLWPTVVGSQPLPNPLWGEITHEAWSDSSHYNSLQAQLVKRLSHGLQFQASYTWSNSIDGGSGFALANPFSSSFNNWPYFDQELKQGLSDWNVKDNLVVSGLWTLPKANLSNRELNYALEGWQIGNIFSFRTGLPFSVDLSGDALGMRSSSNVDFPNRLTGPGCDTAVNPKSSWTALAGYINLTCFALPVSTPAIAAQCRIFPGIAGTCQNLMGNAGRNSLIGPGLINDDFSVYKNNYIGHSERVNAQFRAEFFNIANHANFNAPTNAVALFSNTGVPTPGAGVISAATGTSVTQREIQLALKLIW